MICLGLDISSFKCAWATWDGEHATVGSIHLRGKTPYERASDQLIREYFSGGRASDLWELTAVYMEKPGGPHINTHVAISLVQGAVLQALALPPGVLNVLGPTEWRKELFGTGRMKTEEAKRAALMLANEHGLELTDDEHDEAEAFCLALLAWRTMNGKGEA